MDNLLLTDAIHLDSCISNGGGNGPTNPPETGDRLMLAKLIRFDGICFNYDSKKNRLNNRHWWNANNWEITLMGKYSLHIHWEQARWKIISTSYEKRNW